MNNVEKTLEDEIAKQEKEILEHEKAIVNQQNCLQLLKSQLNSIRNGESGTGVFNQYAMKLALSLPELLEKIFGELDNETFFNSRLVSRSWNNTALATFPKRAVKGQKPRALHLQKLFKCFNDNQIFDIAYFDVKLAKSIKFEDNCMCMKCAEFDECIATNIKFFKFWNQYSSQIERAEFKLNSLNTVFKSIVTNRAENLKAIFFKMTTDFVFSKTLKSTAGIQYCLQKLNTISIKSKAFEPDKDTLEIFIKGAPNLKRLEIGKNFYPDLSNNKKLRYLLIRCQTHDDFSYVNLSRILSQVKDLLETLKLKIDRGSFDDLDQSHFVFPMMPKLKKLKYQTIRLYSLGVASDQTLVEILNSKFPNLSHFHIKDAHSTQRFFDQQSNWVSTGGEQKIINDKILSLNIKYVRNPHFLVHFKNWFPNLKILDLHLRGNLQTSDKIINSTFSNLAQTSLEKFKISMDFEFLLSDLVKALCENVKLFQGLSSFEMEVIGGCPTTPVVRDDLSRFEGLCEKFCEWFVNVTQNSNVVVYKGFCFTVETWKQLKCIRERNLPLKFIYKID